ncbi:hypothetical protein AHAS_Ahas19G0066500 [Arachis hypogaea]
MSYSLTIDALVERWRFETHTFYLPYGECMITLEDVAMIFGLQIHSFSLTGSTNHSTSGLENKYITQFGSAPGPNDHRENGIKLAWFHTVKRRQHLTDRVSKKIYVKCHIMYCQTIIFGCRTSTAVLFWAL